MLFSVHQPIVLDKRTAGDRSSGVINFVLQLSTNWWASWTQQLPLLRERINVSLQALEAFGQLVGVKRYSTFAEWRTMSMKCSARQEGEPHRHLS